MMSCHSACAKTERRVMKKLLCAFVSLSCVCVHAMEPKVGTVVQLSDSQKLVSYAELKEKPKERALIVFQDGSEYKWGFLNHLHRNGSCLVLHTIDGVKRGGAINALSV